MEFDLYILCLSILKPEHHLSTSAPQLDDLLNLSRKLSMWLPLIANWSKYLPKDFKSHQKCVGEYMNILHATNKFQVAKQNVTPH